MFRDNLWVCSMGTLTDEDDFIDASDSLYRMPIVILPLETIELKRGCLIKNVSLDPAIEIFRNASSGSGQLLIDDLEVEVCHQMFG